MGGYILEVGWNVLAIVGWVWCCYSFVRSLRRGYGGSKEIALSGSAPLTLPPIAPASPPGLTTSTSARPPSFDHRFVLLSGAVVKVRVLSNYEPPLFELSELCSPPWSDLPALAKGLLDLHRKLQYPHGIQPPPEAVYVPRHTAEVG